MYWQTRSHAERGEPFQIQDFVGGIQNRRRFAPTAFLLRNPISNFGGEIISFARTFFERKTNWIAPPPPRRASADTKEKCLLLFGFARARFFLNIERTFFFGVLPSKYSGRWRGSMRCLGLAEGGCGGNSAKPSLWFIFAFGIASPKNKESVNLNCLKFWCNLMSVTE